MIIEAGKYYKTKFGRKVGPSEINVYDDMGYRWNVPHGGVFHAYTDHGYSNCGREDYNLIAEWTDTPTGPVIEETVKRIVPGVYGTIQIAAVYDDGVNIHANPGKWAAKDLRAAAVVLNQLAEALSDD